MTANSAEWIDVSVPMRDGMVHWPGNPPVQISRQLDRSRGDPCNVSALAFGAHSGTHVDAPVHVVDGGKGVDSLDPAVGMGSAWVVEITDHVSVKAEVIAGLGLHRGERVLFKTANSPRSWRRDGFDEQAVYLEGDASQALADAGVALIGIDYLSVGGYRCDNGDAAHRPLLEAGLWVLEGLDLTGVTSGGYELCCVPLRLTGCDASPVRALLRTSAVPRGT